MPNTVTLLVEEPDQILNAGAYGAGAIVRLETSATEAGTYAAVTGTGSTPTTAIVTGTRSYIAYDPAGTVSSWYRTRFENVGATRLSDYSDPFQVGEEGGLICSVSDVEQEIGSTLTANERENVLEKIRQVGTAIEGVTGRWFIPRPLNGTTTYRTHTTYGSYLSVPKGITSVTTLGIASTSQPSSGGTYTTITDYWLEPTELERDAGWPATSIWLQPYGSKFYNAAFGVEIVGAFGWSAVPYDIQGVAIRAATRRFIGKGGGGVSVAVGPAGTEFLLPDLSGSDRKTLEWYSVIKGR